MRKIISVLIISLSALGAGQAQQAFYDVIAANGNGLRLWSNDGYKIHMGNTSEYKFGPVTDYSIKTNMDVTPGRGWVWGTPGAAPVFAISNTGNFQSLGQLVLGASTINTTSQFQLNYSAATFPNGAVIKNSSTASTAYTDLLMYNDVNQQGELFLTSNEYSLNPAVRANTFGMATNGTGGLALVASVANAPITFATGTAGTTVMTIKDGGNVGIGSANPDAKLSVKGVIHGQEVKVDLSVPGPDYVFEKGYELPTLAEVKRYVDKNKHLSEVPAAAEMERNGINLSEMNMILLKKIEELTLYVIELQKENDSVKERLNRIENEK